MLVTHHVAGLCPCNKLQHGAAIHRWPITVKNAKGCGQACHTHCTLVVSVQSIQGTSTHSNKIPTRVHSNQKAWRQNSTCNDVQGYSILQKKRQDQSIAAWLSKECTANFTSDGCMPVHNSSNRRKFDHITAASCESTYIHVSF